MAIFSMSVSNLTVGGNGRGAAAAHLRYIARHARNYASGTNVPNAKNLGDLQAFWRDIEREERANGRVMRKVMLALPEELTEEEVAELMADYCEEMFGSRDLPYTWFIHPPDKGDARNWHAHVAFHDRPMHGGNKVRDLMNGSQGLSEAREVWAKHCNRALERYGKAVDHRSLWKQGSDRIPTIHVGCRGGVERKREVNEMIEQANDLTERETQELDSARGRSANDIRGMDANTEAHLAFFSGCKYDIRLVPESESCVAQNLDVETGRKQTRIKKALDAQAVRKNLKWARWQNSSGWAVFIRPEENEPHPYVLLDDISIAGIRWLQRQGFRMLVVRTGSPDSRQAWVECGRDLTAAERGSVQRTLAALVQQHTGTTVDKRATGGNQFGRLSGTTNQKKKNRTENGKQPFAGVESITGNEVLDADALLVPPAVEPKKPTKRTMPKAEPARERGIKRWADYYERALRRHGIGSEAYSEADMSATMGWLRCGLGKTEIERRLRDESLNFPRDHADPDGYIERTLHQAEEYLGITRD